MSLYKQNPLKITDTKFIMLFQSASILKENSDFMGCR
jgi:hypothetical protein